MLEEAVADVFALWAPFVEAKQKGIGRRATCHGGTMWELIGRQK